MGEGQDSWEDMPPAEPAPRSFAELPKNRQIRALQSYAEGYRRALAIRTALGQGPLNRKQLRAAAAYARSPEGQRARTKAFAEQLATKKGGAL